MLYVRLVPGSFWIYRQASKQLFYFGCGQLHESTSGSVWIAGVGELGVENNAVLWLHSGYVAGIKLCTDLQELVAVQMTEQVSEQAPEWLWWIEMLKSFWFCEGETFMTKPGYLFRTTSRLRDVTDGEIWDLEIMSSVLLKCSFRWWAAIHDEMSVKRAEMCAEIWVRGKKGEGDLMVILVLQWATFYVKR